MTVHQNTTLIHVWQLLSKEINDYTNKKQWFLNNVRYVWRRVTHQISELSLPSIRTRQRRHESNRLREKEYYELTPGKLHSDEVRTPLLPSFNRCGAQSQPRHDGYASQEVFRVWKSKEMLNRDRWTTWTIATANPVMTKAVMRRTCLLYTSPSPRD